MHDKLQGANGYPIFFTSQAQNPSPQNPQKVLNGWIILPVLSISLVYAPYLISAFTSDTFPRLKDAYSNECFNEYTNHLLREWWFLSTTLPLSAVFVMGTNFVAA